jgi:DNA invertase Pin-like site-specific DNA recombinase
MSKRLRGFDSLFIKKVAKANLHPVVRALVDVCIERGVPISLVAAKLSASRATVYNWMTGKTTPHPRFLELIPNLTARLRK